MNVVNFIIANWDFILLVVAAVAAVVFAVFKGNKSVVMKMLYALVTEAEKNLGGGTGSLKLATVIETIYPKLPAVIKAFVTDAMLEKWVEEALAAAKTTWEKNAKIAEYIEKPVNENADTAPEE
jgi:hypothetical protein|uniref:Holin n=1 Tax=Siphoviridae sp. ctdHi7 TaxID=2825577 RepID=A0A8S5U1Y9_9CAUD|nr:MAG TPA: holin [Siphoviridae sp. ctdHi7]